jgi:hypothetical protein
MIFSESIFIGIDRRLGSSIQVPIVSNRANLDAYTTRRNVPLIFLRIFKLRPMTPFLLALEIFSLLRISFYRDAARYWFLARDFPGAHSVAVWATPGPLSVVGHSITRKLT